MLKRLDSWLEIAGGPVAIVKKRLQFVTLYCACVAWGYDDSGYSYKKVAICETMCYSIYLLI